MGVNEPLRGRRRPTFSRPDARFLADPRFRQIPRLSNKRATFRRHLRIRLVANRRRAAASRSGVLVSCVECVRMKSRDTLIRLKRFQAEEKRRRVRQIETMVAEFTRMAGDLDREIVSEERRSGISDPGHFAYPTYARAAIAAPRQPQAIDRRTDGPNRGSQGGRARGRRPNC